MALAVDKIRNVSGEKSWFLHLNLNKLSYTVKYFATRRNAKWEKSERSDAAEDLFITDDDVVQASVLEEKKPVVDPDPGFHHIQSSWNELYFICCNTCQNLFYCQAFKHHEESRHLQPQDSTLYQHAIYKKKPKPTSEQGCKKKIKRKKVTTDRHNKKTIDINSNDPESNRDNLGVKFGLGNQKKRKRKTKVGPKKKKPRIGQIIPIGDEKTSCQTVTENYSKHPENSEKVNHLHQGEQNSEIEYDEKTSWQTVMVNYRKEPENGETANNLHHGEQNSAMEYSADIEALASSNHDNSMMNFPSSNLVNDSRFSWFHANSWSILGLTLDKEYTDNTAQSEILEQLPHGAPTKMKESLERNSSEICVENQKLDSSLHDKNDGYLYSLGDGSKLCGFNQMTSTKPVLKFKSHESLFIEKPAHKLCIYPIKLSPTEIRKALNSITKFMARRKSNFKHFYI